MENKIEFCGSDDKKKIWDDEKKCCVDCKTTDFNGKLYEDEEFQPLTSISFNFVSLLGQFEIDTYQESEYEYIVKFTDDKSGNSLKISFPDFVQRKKFLDRVYSNKEIKQTYPGMNAKKIIDSKTLYFGGGLGIGFLLSKFFKRR